MIVPARVNSRGNVVPAFQIDDEFAEQVLARKWNVDKDGYLVIRIKNRKIALHRFVWTLKHGSCPPMLDHVFGDKTDNRLESLRPANTSLNLRNRSRPLPRKRHRLPVGVVFQGPGRTRPYRVAISVQGKQRSIGYFATPEEASAAYEAERARLIAEEAERCRTAFESTTPEEIAR